MQNFPDTVLSQYSDSPTLCQIVADINAWIDPSYDLDQFFNLLWNPDTAEGYGLDRIGRVVGIGRVLTVASGVYLGFSGVSGASGDSFNAGIFYSGQPTTGNFSLTDEAYRKLIFAKAAANITNGSIPAINYILMNVLFPNRGNAYVKDNLNMTLTYTFDFALYPFEVSIVTATAVLPTPCGVRPAITYPGLL